MSTFNEASSYYSDFITYNLPLMFFTLFYGPEPSDINQHNCIYLVLFVTCMYIMTHRKGCVKRMQFIAIVAFCIYTISSIKIYIIRDGGFVKDILSVEEFGTIVFGFYVLANITADIVLIHRCYKIWGAKKKIIVFPVLISIINNAGRIWWIGHQVSKFLPKGKFHHTKHVLAVCLESGIMYPLALIPALVLTFHTFDSVIPSFESLVAILIQVVGIAPTFIIVRVALGISIENVHGTIHMNEGRGQKDQVLSMWEANCNIDECDQTHQSEQCNV
ncbi:hypothetical protein K435DRAFT_800573 [Dendrothele bispora CBS 962.96]|uniref:Uncharacterized protein n=1 Tax=Dendrothele bispora (strain CBS 962.96) TaxID=1314807 RepID=A0A4S8LSN6_DENBC|nr:hypothetical protein K435DRAFT_800573 [Dendrothele bispora CBS 962.96]